jgi:dimethylhistidine N-methyltransferase
MLAATALSPFARDVAEGFARPQKTIPASWLYDDLGSALFEAITLLPEYGLTRADSGLLAAAADSIVAAAGYPGQIVELGSGSGSKTRHILEAAAPVDYAPIDISAAALAACRSTLSAVPGVTMNPVESTYLDGIERALDDKPALILFLGSTIGNFGKPEAEAFLHQIRSRVKPGDAFLVGADLVKDRRRLIAAYDDALGITAAFNLNLLVRINRELGGSFQVADFAHEARYHPPAARIEMHLRSRRAHTVRIDALDLEVKFREGETIWTESCHKFEAEEIRQIGQRAGWQTVRQWIDSDWGFSETLFRA